MHKTLQQKTEEFSKTRYRYNFHRPDHCGAISHWLNRDLTNIERSIFAPLERQRLLGYPMRLFVADGDLDSQPVIHAILTYIAWWSHIHCNRETIMLAAPILKISRQYSRRITQIAKDHRYTPQDNLPTINLATPRRHNKITDHATAAAKIFLHSDLFPRENSSLDQMYRYALDHHPELRKTLIIVHGTYYPSHRTCPFAYHFRRCLGGYDPAFPVHTSDTPRRTKAPKDFAAPRYYKTRASRIARLAQDFFDNEKKLAQNPDEIHTPDLAGLTDDQIISRYDYIFSQISPRYTHYFPQVPIYPYADRAVYPVISKNHSQPTQISQKSQSSQISPSTLRSSRSLRETLDPRRVINISPVNDRYDRPPQYPPYDPHASKRDPNTKPIPCDYGNLSRPFTDDTSVLNLDDPKSEYIRIVLNHHYGPNPADIPLGEYSPIRKPNIPGYYFTPP